MKGTPLTPEHKAKISKANKGKKRDNATKLRMSLARRAMWKRKQQAKGKGK
jgi:hypothetical protein